MATFQERYEEWKKKQTQQESGASSGGTASFQERFNTWRRENRGQQLYQDISRRLEQWSSSYDELAKAYTDRYAGRSEDIGTQAYVGDSGEWYDGFSAKQKALSEQGNELLRLLERDRAVFGDEWTDSVKASILSGQTSYTDMGKLAEQDRNFWASFTPTQEQATAGITGQELYGTWQTDHNYRKKYQDKAYQELKEAASALSDGEERKWLEQYADSVKTVDDYDAELAVLDKRLAHLQEQYDRIYNNDDVDPMTLQVWHTDYVTSAPENRTDPEGDAKKLELYNSLRGEFELFSDVEKEINRVKTEKQRLEHEKKYNILKNNEDFEEYAAKGAAIQNPTIHDAGFFVGPWYFGGDEIGNPVTFSRDNWQALAASAAEGGPGASGNFNYLYNGMTDSEVKNYNYLLAKGRKDEADSYLDYLADDLRAREGKRMSDLVTGIDIPVIEDLAVLGYGFGAGIDQWGSGVKQFFTNEEQPTSVTQYANAYISDSLDGIGHYAHSATTNIGNMAPSILLSSVTAGAGAPATIAKGVGAFAMGTSAAGNAYKDALSKGYDKDSARTYGNLVGISEGTLQYIIGGIDKLGGISGKTAAKIAAIDNSLLRVSAKLGVSLGGEIFEEELQNYLEPAFRSIIFGEEYDAPTMDELIETAIITAISTGVLEGGDTVSSEVTAHRQKQKQRAAVGDTILNTEGGTDALRALALEMADGADSRAQRQLRKLAEQTVDGKQNATRVGKLYGAVQNAITAQNQSDIVKSLERKGFTTAKATAIADAIVAQRSGAELTSRQQKILAEAEQDARIQKTVSDVLENANSTYNGRITEMAKFNLGIISQGFAQEQAAAADPAVAAEESAQVEIPVEETASVADQDGQLLADKTFRQGTNEVVQVHTFTDFANGKATVKLANGETAPAKEISFAESDDNEVFHRTAAAENMTAPAANVIWQLWKNIKENKLPVSAKSFTSAAIATYKAGRFGDETILNDRDPRAAALTKDQRKLIYDTGRRAAQTATDAQQANVDKVFAEANKALQQDGAPRKGTYRAVAVDGLKVSKMNRQQRAAYEMANVVAQGVRVDIELYNGGTEWGYYDHNKDTIRLNANAKWNQTTMMTFTLAHELAHRAKLGSPEKFKAFADFLVKEYGKQGTDLEALIGQQLRAAEEHDRWVPAEQRLNMTEEQAFEEVVADACQRMLLDTDAGQKLAAFGVQNTTNRSVLQDLKKWITEFMDRIRRFFKNAESDSLAAKEFNRFDENTKQTLAKMFVDMTVDAGEKLSTIKEAGMTEKITTGKGGVKYSLNKNAKTELHKALYDKQYRDDVLLRDESPAIMLAQKGVKNRPMAMKASHIRENVFSEQEAKKLGLPIRKDINYHGLGETFFLQVIDGLDDVKEAYRGTKNADNPMRGENYFLLVSTFTDEGGNTINVPVYIDEHAQYNRVFIDVNKISTVFGRQNFHEYIARQIKKANLVRIKNRSNLTSERAAPIAEGYGKNASTDSISNPEQNVNNESVDVAKMSHKLPVSRDVADREQLVDLFEQMVTSSNDYKVLENYRKHLDEMLAIEAQLDRLGAEIRRISFAEGPRDMEYLNKLKLLQKKAINRLNAYDNKLLGLEKSGVLKAMIERYRKQITQDSFDRAKSYYQERNERRENEIRQYYRESRRQAVERHDMAEIRQRIRKDVQRLDSLLNKGTKEKNVKAELKAFAGAALRTAKGTFLKDYNEYDMIRSGVNTTLSREQKAIFARCRELLEELDRIRSEKDAEPAPDNLHDKWDPEAAMRRDDREEALKYELSKNMAILRDAGVFQTENELMEDSTAEQLMDELLETYKALKDSESAHVRGVFSDAVYGQMEEVKKFLAGKAIKDMTSVELKELQKMYRMVLYTITTSNDLFAQKRKADVRKLGEEVISQLRTEGKEMTSEVLDRLAKLGWANLKPETALELIGSETLTEMMQGLYRGEDTYAQDIEHARRFAQEQDKKYGRKNWDLEKSISFAGTKITLGQAMSLYAYTKRKQAQGHLEGDGFTHSSNVRIKDKKDNIPVAMKYVMNATKTYKVTREMYEQVAKLLTPEQRQYVDAMQEYLSAVMGAKGNEVSMKLYGIDLFEETMYFPLKTAAEFRDTALAVNTGDVKLKNSGFTKSTQDKAANPIVLDDFEKVWAAHVDKMSLYHGFVLPMEDFDRVYNYHRAVEQDVADASGKVYKTELVDTNETVKIDIENKMGKVANAYIENFMQQLNGGVRGDPTENLFGGGMIKSFKKAAVMGSLSVAVQQPTAFVRAMAYLDMQDVADWRKWLGKTGKPDGKLVEEMYKYAPVALMKRIGGFDPNLGRSAQNYIFGGRGVSEIVDTVGSWLPEHMDEWTWTYIWVCTKRQIHRQNPELRVGSEEFCQKAGERFSQIIRRTQVYDSVLTKSQIMRSKNIYLQMSTAFMNEPTTSLDMYISATVRAKQGKISKKQAARVYGSVVCSQILVAAISAFVYAARDDDEDETYWEKYMSSFVGKSIEGVTMLQSIPFVRDVVSIFEGYSSERSDMALVEDLYQGWQTLQSDKATPWEKVEAFGGSILNFFGIPAKNISRDLRGIFRVVENIFKSSQVEPTDAGMRYAIMEGLPFTDKPTKTVQMENAVKENDAEHILRLLGTYNTEDAANTAFRKVVKEVYLRGDVAAEKAMEFLQVYAGDDAEEAQEYLIKWEFKQKHTDAELSDAQILDWTDYAEPAGISLDIYTRFVEKIGKDSKKEDALEVIDDLPISRKQKDALYLSRGYAESGLDDAPWN